MAIYCAIITPQIRELAKELGFSDAYVNNMVSVWQTAYRRNVIPTAKDLRDYFYDPGYQDRLKSAYFVVPRYRTVEHNPSAQRMTTIDWNGNFVVMQKLPHGNPLGYFFDQFKDHPELQDVIRSTKEAYQFLLWREQWHIMYGDGGHARPEEAFNFAYKKAKRFKDSHEVKIIQENTNDNPKPSNAPVVQPQQTQKVVEPLPITKIISGGQTGIDTLGLQIASEFGIETGGNAPVGFEREKGQDEFNEENLKQWGLTEVDKREEIEYLNSIGRSRKSPGAQYVYRTYKNVNDSDGTVFFRAKSSGEDRGLTATLNAARALGKPFIIDPTAEELRDWVNKHGIKVLNVAGSRGSHLVGTKGKEIANNVLRAALAGNNKNAPRPQVVETTQQEQQNSPEEYKVEYKKNNQTYTVRQDNEGYHIINKKGEEVYTNEDDGNRRMILAKLELQKGGVVVTYNNNKFIVTSDNRILSGVDGNEVYKENSEKQREDIYKLAEEKKNTPIQDITPPQQTPQEETNPEDLEDLERLDYEIRSRAYQQAVERNKQQQQQQSSIGKPAPAGITPNLRGEMKFSFGNDKRPEVVSTTTIEAIKRGERTATTRWNYLDKWKNAKIGDIILFYDENTNQAVYVKVTKPAHQLSVDTDPEEWSKKEGWSTDHYEHYVEPRVKRGEAWQFEYEYIGDTDMPQINKPKYVYEGSGELSPEEEAKLAAMGANKVQYITAAQANDPDYVPKIDVSQVVHFNPDNPRIKLIRDFTAQQLADRTQQMARDFSDRLDSVIDDMLEERTEKITSNMNRLREITGNDKGISFSSSLSPEQVTEVNSLRKEIDELNSEVNILEDATLGRRWALQKYTIERIIDDLKQQYQEWAEMSEADYEEAYGKDRGAYMKDAYEKIVDNFDGIWQDATIIIEGNENFRVISREVIRNNGPLLGEEVKLSGDVTDNVNTEDDNNAQFEDDEDGKRATGNDGWSYQIRFVDPLTSLSKDVRRVLGNIIKKRPTGTRKVKDKNTGEEREEIIWTPETDDLGNFRYINPEAAHAIILSELSDMIDADDFIVKNSNGDIVSLPALERLVDKYPWINQVIQQLKQDDRLCSKFYHDFRKDFIPCWMQVYGEVKDDYGNGTGVFKWQLMQMNKETALDSTMTQITRNYEQGNVLSEHSIYTASKEISKAGSQWVVDECNDLMSDLAGIDPDEYDEISEKIAEVLRAVGLNTNKHIVSNLLQSTDGLQQVRQVVDSARSIGQEIQNAPKGSHPIDYFKQEGYYTKIAELMGIVSELDHVQSFRQGDKTYQSYSAPNYIETCIKKLKSDTRREQYLQQQFKDYDWFYKDGKWRNEWLRLIEEDEDFRFGLETKEVNTIQLKKGEGKKAEYRNWTPSRIRQGFVREFFSIGINPNSEKQFAWYNMPIFSDSPVAKFIKFKRFVGEDYKDQLLDHFTDVVMQELDRIKLVLDRKKGIAEANQVSMSNFDKVGDKFHFFPELNDKETFNYGGQSFLEVCAQLNKANDLIGLKALIRQAVTQIMDTNFREFLDDFTQEDKTSTSEYLMREGAITTAEELNMALENYFWNQAFATTQIIQITTTDLAYYKDDVDFQKRYKEVYAAGNKLNTNSRYGKKTQKVVYLSDQVITSATYVDIKRSLNEAVRAERIKSFDRDNILNKFKDINVADAQAYRSLESMRSVLDMMGAWDDKMEAAFNRFKRGQWDMEDFNLVWQTIKPFMYTQISKPAYSKEYLDAKLSRGEITQEEYQKMRAKRIKVPHQNKNSEFLLLSTYAMVANSMGKSAKLRGIERFMKDNEIDLIQFESAVKAGCQGTIDLSYNEEKLNALYEPKKTLFENTVKDAIREELKKKRVAPEDIEKKVKSSFDKLSKFEILKRAADVLLDKGRISQEQYNEWFESIEPSEQDVYNILNSQTKDGDGNFREEVVHTLPYDDYCVQQPTPEHLFDITNNVFGSQFRNLIISDMPDDPNFRVTVNGRDFTKQQIRDLYQANIVENLLDGFQKATDKFQNIRTLQAFLLDQVRGNPKYGRDILDALQIVRITNPSTGYPEEVFNIPLDNPTTSLKIQELITSVFKNNVTKQTIRGGACILVSDFGLTKELQVLHDEKTGAITGIECYLPAYSKKFYQPFMVEKTTPEGETYMELDIKKMPDEMKKLVGYRIPTEDKYSMAPLIVKGFLPQQNGSSIMLPADITQIAGSDFDVDKMFLMIPSFHTINRYDMKAAWREFYKQHPDLSKQIDQAQQEWFESYIEDEIEDNPDLADTLDINDEELKKKYLKEMGLPRWEYLLGTKKKFEQWFKQNRDGFFIKTDIIKERYNFDKSPQQHTKQQRDNLLIDIAHAILTHPDTAQKIHDPGNYDKAKLGARVDSIITDASLLKKFVQQFNISTEGDIVQNIRRAIQSMVDEGELDALNEFIKDNRKQRSQLTLNTFIYNHTQNMTGGALIGMYANNTTMQAKFQESEISAKVFRTFTVNGRPLNSLHDIYSQTGERISKNCANFSAASVDNVKDPVLADLLQNTGTANVTGLMLRAGMTVHEISLFFAQPAVRKMIHDMGELKADAVSNVVDNYRSLYEAQGGLLPSNLDILKTHNVTTSSLMDTVLRDTLGIESSNQTERMKWDEEELKNLIVFANIVEMSEKLGDLTRIARADSPNGAIEPSIAKSTGQIQRVLRFAMESSQRDFPLRGVGEIVQLGYLDMNMSKDEMREKLLSHPMPMLQSFFSLGIDLGFEIMSNYFSQASPFMQWQATQLMLNSDKGYLKDTALNRFFNEAITFALSKTTLFGDNDETGDTYEQKREYYLYQFPKKFEKLILDNPDLKQLDIIKKLSIGQSGDIEMFNSGRLTPLMRESLMRSMDSLLFDEDNPEAQKLAVDLFMYAYYKDGFRFGPNSFGTFFSSNFISSFPEVIDTLRELKYNMREGTFMREYLPQYYANHVNEAGLPWIDPKSGRWSGKYELTEDGKLLVETKSVINPLTKGNYQPVRKDRQSHIQYIKNKLFALNGFDDFRFYEYNAIDNKRLSPYFKYITFGGILYEFQQTQDVTKVAYVPVYSSIKDNKGVRYNANQRAQDIYKELLDKQKKANNDQTTQNSAPVVNEELSEVQKALAEQAIATQGGAQQASAPQQQAAGIEETMTDVIDNIEGESNTSAIEDSSLDSIESQSSMIDQAIQQVARLEEQYTVTTLFSIDDSIEQQTQEPDIEQYPEEEGEKVLGEPICKTGGAVKKANTSKLEDLDLPDF